MPPFKFLRSTYAPRVDPTGQSVIDGDTIDVATFGRVRLLGIDAPEIGRGFDTSAPFGREARDRLTTLILRHWVRLEQEGAAVDVYNRHLAYVLTEAVRGLTTLGARRAGARFGANARALAGAPARRERSAGFRRGTCGARCRRFQRAELYSASGEPASPVSDVSNQDAIDQAANHAQKETVNAIPVEYASERKIRERNKLHYRFNHWPIWIFVFFIAPGPLTFDLFERGFDARMALWLGAVLLGTGIAGLRGRLPGVEPKPYIIRFTEDRPNPLYRRVCYTFAWSEVITFAVLNVTGLVVAIITGEWYLKQIYQYAYFARRPIWLLARSDCSRA